MRFKRFAVLSCVLFMVPFCVLLQIGSTYAQHVIKKDSPELKALIDE
jgi:hypothetical protein